MPSALSSGEKRVAALISTCYGMLLDDDIAEMYIDQDTSAMIDKIREGLYNLLVPYSAYEKEIATTGRVVESKLRRDNHNYLVSNTQLVMAILYLAFQPNERGFDKLPKKVKEWYRENKETILEISYRSADSKEFKDSDEGSYLLAHSVLSAFKK